MSGHGGQRSPAESAMTLFLLLWSMNRGPRVRTAHASLETATDSAVA